MAKLFYTLVEAAAKLGKSPAKIQEMAKNGQLQEYRQDDAVLFKVADIDQLATDDSALDLELPPDFGSGADLSDLELPELSDLGPMSDQPLEIDEATPSAGSALGAMNFGSAAADAGLISLEDSDPFMGGLDLDDSKPGALGSRPLGLADSNPLPAGSPVGDSAGDSSELAESSLAFGVPVGSDDLNLETVGSGSGLLDLTRESEDTSIGAAMLEEAFDDPSVDGSGGLGAPLDDVSGLGDGGATPVTIVGGALGGLAAASIPAYDGGWSGLTVGAMLASFVCILCVLTLSMATIVGGSSSLLPIFVDNLWAITGGLGGFAGLAMGIGFFVGRATE